MAQAAAATRTMPKAPLSRAALGWQAIGSFLIVVAAYCLYWLVAVPFIEPNVEEQVAVRTSDEVIEEARADVTARQREIARYFEPGDWETDKPAIGQSGEVRLLYKTLKPKSDGTVELRPCTLMFFAKGDVGPARPIIMRALEGADIRFDQRIDLKSVDLKERKLIGGQLIGPIRIYQKETAPGAADDLEIAARDVKLDGNRASSPHPVNFRLGASRGSGRDLEILLGAPDGRSAEANAMRSASIHTVRLNHDVRMRLELAAGPQAASQANEPPIEITCQGPFEFDVEDYAASFHDTVDVFRLNPVGESDQLNCQLLSIFFARPGQTLIDEAAPSGARPNANLASRVRLIEARGKPVTMRSPAQGIYASCDGVDFVPGVSGTPGSLAAYGPGVIRGKLPNDPAGNYVAQWARELRFEPDGPLHKATLRGATVMRIGTMGTITADEAFAWMSPKPAPSQMPVAPVAHRRDAAAPAAPINAGAWQIERVMARRYPPPAEQTTGDVVIESPQLHAVAASLEATIERSGQSPNAAAAAPAAPNAHEPPNPKRQPQTPGEFFDVTGRTVSIRLVPRGDELAVAAATIEGSAQLEQFSTAAGKQRSLLVKGERLDVTDAHTPATRVAIAGSPGYVEAGGMTLWGGAIELARDKNWLWINGPGRLAMPVTQDLDGKPLPRAQMLTVDWKRRMDFQSDTAVFDGAVVARSAQQVLNAPRLEATLTQAVDFSKPNLGGRLRPDLAAVRSHGPTSLESRQFGDDGAQSAHSRMELADLSINRTSGQITGRGPGWVRHVARGTAPQILPPTAGRPKPDPAHAAKQFTYLYITFRQGIDGNIDRRAIRFFDHTRTIYGPVSDWNDTLDDNDLAALGPDGLTLDADQLEVREMNRRADAKRGWFELAASGSVFAESQRFTARGSQLTYAEEKQLLILRGDPAEMFLEDESLSQRIEHRASEVSYWIALRRVTVSGTRGGSVILPADVQKRVFERPRPSPAPAAP
jgi:hypothetical protein